MNGSAREPRNPDLLELRAELAGQWSDYEAQVADYTAAIEVLSSSRHRRPRPTSSGFIGRRGNAHVALRQWQQAVDDYAKGITGETTDEHLLANQSLALAESLLGVDILVPTSERRRTKWHFTTTKPADLWTQPDFKTRAGRSVGTFGTVDVERTCTAWTTPRSSGSGAASNSELAKNVKSRDLLRDSIATITRKCS